MPHSLTLPVREILDQDGDGGPGEKIGRSREGRPLVGHRFGTGPLKVSLIAGCHADEPVGPRTLAELCSFLARRRRESPWLQRISWRIVPHANPDGRERNLSWSRELVSLDHARLSSATGYDVATYLATVVREQPGDDMEFGFPRGDADREARPENRAIARFLAEGGPYHLHGSLHGMAFAPGPWFLIEPSWIGRTLEMRKRLRRRVRALEYALFDPDRKGEKGFERIDKGFSTRPDSEAMRRFFEASGDSATAARFRPSSMEFVRSLGGSPLTFVSEMPLFLTPSSSSGDTIELADIRALRARLEYALHRGEDLEAVSRAEGVRPMPIPDQQRLQLELISEAMEAAR